MQSERPDLEQLLAKAVDWLIHPDGRFQATIVRQVTLVPFNVSLEELQSRHPLLPYVIEALANYEDPATQVRRTRGPLVLNTLAVLDNKTVLAWNEEQGFETFNWFGKIEPSQTVRDLIVVTGQMFHLRKHSDVGPSVPLVLDSAVQQMSIPCSHLSRIYPNWEKRLAVGQELGLQGRDLGRFVCEKTQPFDVVMGEVCFGPDR